MHMTGQSPLPRYQHYIDGRFVDSSSNRRFTVTNPYSGVDLLEVPAGNREDAGIAVAAAAAAAPAWAALAPGAKRALFLRAADLLEQRTTDVVSLLAEETGACFGFAMFQVNWSLTLLRHAAGWVYRQNGEILPSDLSLDLSMVIRKPHGVVAGFTPWNGAAVLAWRTIVLPLAFGNTIVVKPSELAPVSAGLFVAQILHDAGFPAGVVNIVTHQPGDAALIADEFFENAHVRCINFTGSTQTGRMLAVRAAQSFKRIVLELGGYNQLAVLEDADLDRAVEAVAFGAFFHQGQICMNTRKVLVHESIAERFVEKLVDRVRAVKIGNPRDRDTVIGPLINEAARKKAAERIADAVERGGRVVLGGNLIGPCLQPAILTDVPDGVDVTCEETFAPILVVRSVKDAEEAVRLINSSRFGLSASVFTRNEMRGIALARRIDSGMVHVNNQTVFDEAHMPAGGVGESGVGRSGLPAIEDFTEMKWISVAGAGPLFAHLD
jgi:acyl-CoA reductase-like NAD-dependent aldehyde dehydrogenase